jgi:hypothetical protein
VEAGHNDPQDQNALGLLFSVLSGSFEALVIAFAATPSSSKYSLTMTTVVYILLHLDSVLNELFSRLFIFFTVVTSH